MYIPKEAYKTALGNILMTFAVNKDGKLVKQKIIKGLDYRLDKKAIKSIE
ncbi:hypothetical protein OIU83_03415 [Flavobacterium sp. LS1R49]|uniref:TonB C-terminal domain-containing protein n=1 Tax=Flavobacterium shii TaxID=2987687 RepID=A0A9X2Z9N7_9FLAO|nr:hypothetical protein [Flavobacterium shii]MCV9926679.1 hypothetical protein [Flavobacterium shii]